MDAYGGAGGFGAATGAGGSYAQMAGTYDAALPGLDGGGGFSASPFGGTPSTLARSYGAPAGMSPLPGEASYGGTMPGELAPASYAAYSAPCGTTVAGGSQSALSPFAASSYDRAQSPMQGAEVAGDLAKDTEAYSFPTAGSFVAEPYTEQGEVAYQPPRSYPTVATAYGEPRSVSPMAGRVIAVERVNSRGLHGVYAQVPRSVSPMPGMVSGGNHTTPAYSYGAASSYDRAPSPMRTADPCAPRMVEPTKEYSFPTAGSFVAEPYTEAGEVTYQQPAMAYASPAMHGDPRSMSPMHGRASSPMGARAASPMYGEPASPMYGERYTVSPMGGAYGDGGYRSPHHPGPEYGAGYGGSASSWAYGGGQPMNSYASGPGASFPGGAGPSTAYRGAPSAGDPNAGQSASYNLPAGRSAGPPHGYGGYHAPHDPYAVGADMRYPSPMGTSQLGPSFPTAGSFIADASLYPAMGQTGSFAPPPSDYGAAPLGTFSSLSQYGGPSSSSMAPPPIPLYGGYGNSYGGAGPGMGASPMGGMPGLGGFPGGMSDLGGGSSSPFPPPTGSFLASLDSHAPSFASGPAPGLGGLGGGLGASGSGLNLGGPPGQSASAPPGEARPDFAARSGRSSGPSQRGGDDEVSSPDRRERPPRGVRPPRDSSTRTRKRAGRAGCC